MICRDAIRITSKGIQEKMPASGVVVGRITNVEAHPRADRLSIASVDLGDGHPTRTIVFGGTRNLAKDDLVPVAPPGARLPDGKRIRRRRYRGELSNGMLCSVGELGWAVEGPDEVAVLDDRLIPGMSLDNIKDPLDLLRKPYGQLPSSRIYP
jgi:tRNA-binding EMAP/Myf-like protein